MLGRKTFTQEELDSAREAVAGQIAAYDGGEAAIFNALLLGLDRRFVHRVRMVTGKDSNPLNEVELLVESLMNNGGVLRSGTVVKYVPEQTVLGLSEGDRIELSATGFERISTAFLDEIESKFL
jgi:hypothetical protein